MPELGQWLAGLVKASDPSIRKTQVPCSPVQWLYIKAFDPSIQKAQVPCSLHYKKSTTLRSAQLHSCWVHDM